jgi:hypothetical protein
MLIALNGFIGNALLDLRLAVAQILALFGQIVALRRASMRALTFSTTSLRFFFSVIYAG